MAALPHPGYNLFLIMFLSGFAGLGYEMVWTRMFSAGLGHEILAVLAVIGALFCGMALGAWSLDPVVSRSPRPGRWYAALELTVGLWSLALILLIPLSNRWAASLLGGNPAPLHHWSIAFVLAFVVLLPATFSMGATLPAMERLYSRLTRRGWTVPGLYAVNTLGAVAGTLITTYMIAPKLGFRATAMSLAAVNLVCALAILASAARNEADRPPLSAPRNGLIATGRIHLSLFVTGLLGIGYEVVVIRVLSQVLENTIFTFASLLSVYLLGIASGAALYQLFAPRFKLEWVLTGLLHKVALSCLLGSALLPRSQAIYEWLRGVFGAGYWGTLAAEIGLSALILLLPTLAMGATFSHLAQAARGPSGGVGRSLCLNTLGAALAPVVFGVILLPALGSKYTLVLLSLVYLTLIPRRRWTHWLPALIPLGIGAILAANTGNLNLIQLAPGQRIAKHAEGVMATVTVVTDHRENHFLKVNNKFLMGGTASQFSDGRQGHIPLLLHPRPRSALFLGLGTGATLAVSADHPGLEAHGVELLPEIVEMLPYFERTAGSLTRNPQLHIHVADARRFVRSQSDPYDVIVADLFHPGRDGAGFLYTVEHFEAIRSLLAADGLFCQWLPLHQMDLALLQTVIRTYLTVFPDAIGVLAAYSLQTPIVGLIGGKAPLYFSSEYFDRRLGSGTLVDTLGKYRLQSPYMLFGALLGGPRDLVRFAGGGPLNTDNHPVVMFQAPQFANQSGEPAHMRLLALLDYFNPTPRDILMGKDGPEGERMATRLAAYWRARDKFLRAGVGIRRTADIEAMLAQVQDPLLAAVRESADFEAAYNPLLAMAERLHRTNPQASVQLLYELESANPVRSDARRVREHLEASK